MDVNSGDSGTAGGGGGAAAGGWLPAASPSRREPAPCPVPVPAASPSGRPPVLCTTSRASRPEDGEDVALGGLAALLDAQFLDHARHRGGERDLYLHRLHDQHGVAGAHLLPLRHDHLPHVPGHLCAQFHNTSLLVRPAVMCPPGGRRPAPCARTPPAGRPSTRRPTDP